MQYSCGVKFRASDVKVMFIIITCIRIYIYIYINIIYHRVDRLYK